MAFPLSTKDHSAIAALAAAGVHVYESIILPSGRRVSALEANTLIEAVGAMNAAREAALAWDRAGRPGYQPDEEER